MLVGLLAKLLALLLLVLAAVGLFVGGRHFASLLEKRFGGTPPTYVRSAPTPAPTPVAAPHQGTPRGAPRMAAASPAPRRAQPLPVLAPQHPSRGALRPQAEPAPRPHAQGPPGPVVQQAPTPPPAEAPSPAPAADTAAPVVPVIVAAVPPPPSAPSPESAPRPHHMEPVLVDLQIGRLVNRTVTAYREGDEALVPLGAFLEMAEIQHEISPAGVLTARLEPSGTPVHLAAGSDSLTVGDRVIPLLGWQVRFVDGELYLASAPLGDALGLSFDVSWPDLTVAVLNPEGLPVAQRMYRDQMRALLAQRQGARPDTTFAPLNTSLGGLVFDYNVSFPYTQDAFGGSAYQFGLGAQVAGGALEAGIRSIGTTETGSTEVGVTWRGVWIEKKWLKQLTLGTGTLTGPRYAGIRGVSATNSPYVRPSFVGQLNYYGRLDPGWQLEAYTGSQLVAFDSIGPTGSYDLTLPVSYGENPVDFVAYGPYGQVRRFNQTYRVVSEQLPYKEFDYGVSGGECISSLCDAAANADLWYGLSRRVTVRGGFEGYWRDSLPDLLHPYAGVTGLLGNSLTLAGEVVGNGWVRGGVRIEPSLNLRLGAAYSVFDEQVVQSMIAPVGSRSQLLLDAFLRPLPMVPSFYLQGLAEVVQGVTLDATRARLTASVQTGAVRLYPYVRYESLSEAGGPSNGNSYLGASAYATGRPSWGSVLGTLWFRGDIETGGGAGFQFGAISVAKSFGPALRVEGSAGWRRNEPGTTLMLSLVSYLPTLQATTTAVAPAVGDAGAIQTLQGTLAYDAAQRRVTANPNPGLQRSGVSGRVFLDENGNGLPDPDEPGVAGVRVIVGSNTARSDSLGRFHVWDIPAFEPVQVEVDTTSLENPLYVPAFTSAMLAPPPNGYRELNLPLVAGTVLEGRVELAGSPVPDINLVLTDRASGKRRAAATFSDGSFYVMGVKPGRYTLEVDPRDLAARRLAGTPLTITASPAHPEQLSNLVVEVRAAAPAAR